MISTIFFDLDGTLIDQKTAQNAACLTIYRRYHFDAVVSEDHFIRKWDALTVLHYDTYLRRECTYNQQRERRITDLFSAYGIACSKTPLEVYDEYLRSFESSWRPFPEVTACLEALKDYRLGVLTNGDAGQQNQKLAATALAPYFSHVICAGDYPFAKPDTRLFEEIRSIANVPLSECLYVGDSYESDIVPCLALGMKCVLVDRQNASTHRDTPVISGFAQLPQILAQLNSR